MTEPAPQARSRAVAVSTVSAPFPRTYDRSKMTDWVFEELKDAIVNLRLLPGEPLREAALASRLGVSKTPVREALTRLEAEGLVESTSFRGSVVSSYTRRDLIDLYELRELLEIWAVREAANSMSDQDLERLDALMADALRFRDSGDMKALEQAVDEFDVFVFEHVTNRRIGAVVDNLRVHLVRIGRLTAEIPGRLATSVSEHALIADALRRRDPDAASWALHDHIASVRDDQLRTLPDHGGDIA